MTDVSERVKLEKCLIELEEWWDRGTFATAEVRELIGAIKCELDGSVYDPNMPNNCLERVPDYLIDSVRELRTRDGVDQEVSYRAARFLLRVQEHEERDSQTAGGTSADI